MKPERRAMLDKKNVGKNCPAKINKRRTTIQKDSPTINVCVEKVECLYSSISKCLKAGLHLHISILFLMYCMAFVGFLKIGL